MLQEHPVHPDELADCLRVARRTRTQYLVNTFYPQLEPVRRFTSAARALIRQRRPVFVDALCAVQVSFDLLDILAGVFDGLRPWSLTPVGESASRPLAGVHGTVAGVPLTLRVENRMKEGDDSSSLLLHRITIGTDAGNLMLANTHGPVIWSPVLRMSSDPTGLWFPDGMAPDGGRPADSGVTGAYVGSPETPTWSEAVRDVWAHGVVSALDALRERIGAGADPLRGGQRHLTVARAWKELTEGLGYPEPSTPDPGEPLTVADL